MQLTWTESGVPQPSEDHSTDFARTAMMNLTGKLQFKLKSRIISFSLFLWLQICVEASALFHGIFFHIIKTFF